MTSEEEQAIRKDERARWAKRFEEAAEWNRGCANSMNWDYQRAVAQGYELASRELVKANAASLGGTQRIEL